MEGSNDIPSEFLDVRPKEQMDENKRKTLFRINEQPTDIPLVDEGALSQILLGYASNERTDTKIVVTSLVLSGLIEVRSDVTASPSNFGNCVGRLFVIADTMARSPTGPHIPLDLEDVFQVATAEEAIYGLERIDSHRYVILCREPIDIPMEVCPVSSIAEVPTFHSVPRFSDYYTAFINGVNPGKEAIIGGASFDDADRAINVGAHYNLDVPQHGGPNDFNQVPYPRVNIANTTPTYALAPNPICRQVQFVTGAVIPPPLDPTHPGMRILNNPDVGIYGRDSIAGISSGGIAWPDYVNPMYQIGSTITHTTVQGKRLIDLEIDFPDGIFVEYERIGVVDRPDVEIFVCLILTGGVYRVKFKHYTGIYFTDDDVWGVNHNVKAGTARFDIPEGRTVHFDPPEERDEDVDPPDWFYDDEEPIDEPVDIPSPKFIPKRSRRSFSQK